MSDRAIRVSMHAIERYLWRVPGVAERLRDEILAIVNSASPDEYIDVVAADGCTYCVEGDMVVTILGGDMRQKKRKKRCAKVEQP